MTGLGHKITSVTTKKNQLAVFWLAQSGFAFRTSSGKTIYVDPYLSNSTHRLYPDVGFGFKRLSYPPLQPDHVEADYCLFSHNHPDHLDIDLLQVLAKMESVQFIAAPDCKDYLEQEKVSSNRFQILNLGQTIEIDRSTSVTGVFADHGEQAPEALGFLLAMDDIRVWFVADSAFRPDHWQDIFNQGVDIILPPINGAYGNLNEYDAAVLAGLAHARVAIPAHFGMFAEHGGDPGLFMDACKKYSPSVNATLVSPGELFLFDKTGS